MVFDYIPYAISPIMNDEAAGVQVEKDYMHIETEEQLETYKESLVAAKTLVVDIENISSLSFIANTDVGSVSIFPEEGLYIIGVEPTPTNDACGV